MIKPEFSVERHNFFHQKAAQTLRFSEHAPPVTECDHPICNCTKNVAQRPEGEPNQITQEITLILPEIEDLKPDFRLSKNWLTFRWADQYAYFIFNPKETSLQIKIPIPNYSLTDRFFANLFLGNKIDTSTLYNGHSPSKVINLSKLDEKLWLHECDWGREAVRIFGESEESKSVWRCSFILSDKIKQLSSKYVQILNQPVEEIYRSINEDTELMEMISFLVSTLAPIVMSIRTTELFKLAEEIREETLDSKIKQAIAARLVSLNLNDEA